MVSCSPFRILVASLLLSIPLLAVDQKPVAKEGWLEIHSAHFSVVTDAGEKRGREVALRLEQMRAVFGDLLMRDKLKMPVPLKVLALKSDKDYEHICPLRGGQPIAAPGFFLAGEDQNLIVLNLFANEPWQAIGHAFAHMLLDGNYPPTQAWFDEGFAEYFSSLRVDNKQVDLGGDPEQGAKYSEDLLGNINEVRNSPHSLTTLLIGPVWLNMTDLFTMRLNTPEYQEGTHRTLFYAQSWMVMHYLLAKKMLSQAGAYFDLVQNQNLPVPQAMQQALGMTPEQFEKAVKDYFQSLESLFIAQDEANRSVQLQDRPQITQFPVPIGAGDVAMVVKKLNDDDAHALVADVLDRQPEHRAEGQKELEALAAQPADNEIAHRALAYAYIQKQNFKQANDELQQAGEDNPKDPWVWYYRALLRFRIAQATGNAMGGALANVQQNLRAVIEWYPDFGEAYHLLALAELEGGATNAALDSMRSAIQLSPRREWYVMSLADIYLEGKKWDNAQTILERLKTSANPQIASRARKKLNDLPFIKKYGISPERAAQKNLEASSGNTTVSDTDAGDTEAANPVPKLKERPADKRQVQYLKGRILSVDCSQSPAAVVTVVSGTRTLKLRTTDYKSVVLIGAAQFSCAWREQAASVNYKAIGKSEGDLVSLEIE